ncbi:Tripeptidyl-peptidase 2 [Papilio xuthus]|uniref:Tripeptidyl-peptidase 2 n=1 Tax=Papilio xuthus TaxID=66420 RepID=A0A194PVP7_PAPXU|nr:Tripeptidyl-peptidase 2 [Papilio xuthus]
MKRALENSATHLPHVEPWAQGCGLLNIEKAFEILTKYHSEVERDVTFSVQCGPHNGKGILLRPRPADPPQDIGVTVEPHFLLDHTDLHNKSVIPKQIAFGVRLALVCAAPWVSAPAHLDLMNAARALALRLRTSHLPPGPHHARYPPPPHTTTHLDLMNAHLPPGPHHARYPPHPHTRTPRPHERRARPRPAPAHLPPAARTPPRQVPPTPPHPHTSTS